MGLPRIALSWALCAIIAVANYAHRSVRRSFERFGLENRRVRQVQHHLPPPVPEAWYDENGLDMGAHEVQLRQHVDCWVYLTAQMLCILLVYHAVSAAAETFGRLRGVAYAAAPACLGLGLVVYGLFFFFFVMMLTVNPKWRDQWRAASRGRERRRAPRAGGPTTNPSATPTSGGCTRCTRRSGSARSST